MCSRTRGGFRLERLARTLAACEKMRHLCGLVFAQTPAEARPRVMRSDTEKDVAAQTHLSAIVPEVWLAPMTPNGYFGYSGS